MRYSLDQVVQTLHRTGFDPNTYLTFGSAAILLHNTPRARSPRDVDIMVEQTVFDESADAMSLPSGLSLLRETHDDELLLLCTMGLGSGLPPLHISRAARANFNAELIGARQVPTSLGKVNVMSQKDIVASKLGTLRPKDWLDIYRLRHYLPHEW